MSDDPRATLAAYIAEALTLRFAGHRIPEPGAPPEAIHAVLRAVRTNLDTVERMLGTAMRWHAEATRVRNHAQATLDDAWDRAVTNERNAPVARGGEYTSARERHAYANLETLDLRHTVRHATALLDACASAVDQLRLCHRGLDGVRHDLLTWLRAAAPYESTWER